MAPSLKELAGKMGIPVEKTGGIVVVRKGHEIEERCEPGSMQHEWGGIIEVVSEIQHILRCGVISGGGAGTRDFHFNDDDYLEEIMSKEEAAERIKEGNLKRWGIRRFF